MHGHTLVDDYAWLRAKEDPAVTAYLEAENAYRPATMAGTEELQKQLYEEMLSHIKETDVSVPFRDGEYWYYLRTEQGQAVRDVLPQAGTGGRSGGRGRDCAGRERAG